jgi:hypothetical protein
VNCTFGSTGLPLMSKALPMIKTARTLDMFKSMVSSAKCIPDIVLVFGTSMKSASRHTGACSAPKPEDKLQRVRLRASSEVSFRIKLLGIGV